MGDCEHTEIEQSTATVKVGRTTYDHDRLACTECTERVVLVQQRGARR